MPLSELAMVLSLRGPLPALELRRALGVSPATLSRMVAAEDAQVLRMGRARATGYGLRRPLAGLPGRLPIFRIDAGGAPREVSVLHPLVHGAWVEQAGQGRERAGHLYARVPPALAD